MAVLSLLISAVGCHLPLLPQGTVVCDLASHLLLGCSEASQDFLGALQTDYILTT